MTSKNEFMNFEYGIRMFKFGKWRAVNIEDLSEQEFRNYIMWKLGFVGIRKNG